MGLKQNAGREDRIVDCREGFVFQGFSELYFGYSSVRKWLEVVRCVEGGREDLKQKRDCLKEGVVL